MSTPTREELDKLSKTDLLKLEEADGAKKSWNNDKIVAHILGGVTSVTFVLPSGAQRRRVHVPVPDEDGEEGAVKRTPVVFEGGEYTTKDKDIAKGLYALGYDVQSEETEERQPLPNLV